MLEKINRVKLERGAPDRVFVSKLTGAKIQEVENEIELVRKDLGFKNIIEETLGKGGKKGYIQICAPFELQALAQILQATNIVEVGVSAGVSSAYLLNGMSRVGGVLHSIDLPERGKDKYQYSWALPKGKEPGWAIPPHLKNRKNWDLRLGRSSDVLPKLIPEIDSPIDIFLYDVPYEIEDAIEDFKIVDQKLRKGSVVLADNCQVPITWWARKRKAKVYTRKGSGLRGFRVP